MWQLPVLQQGYRFMYQMLCDNWAVAFRFDMQGKQLSTSIVGNYPEMNIDVKDLISGIYLIQLKGERTAIAKFVVNN
ncbi:MAG: T9SS type A sorting domain-containing protein [Paludibacter sp.]